jgi:hypothetical protein
MFFECKDMIAVHTVAAASLEILRQIGKPRGCSSLFDEIERIRPEHRKTIVTLIRQPQNFFKHAGKDPDKTLNFFFEATKFYLFDTARLLHQLTNQITPETSCFIGWFLVKYPDFFDLNDDSPELEPIGELSKRLNPDDFEMVLSTINEFKD